MTPRTRNVHLVTGALSMRHADGEIEPHWFTERKMGPKDVAHDIAILWLAAHYLRTILFVLMFDFKKFFHMLVLSALEMVNTGCVLQERAAAGGASQSLIRMLEQVLSMGVSPASNVMQETGDYME